MRWPIRLQILWPFASVVAVSVAVLTIAAAVRAARQSEEETRVRLERTVETLSQLPVPYTAAVLGHMRGLSGAEFVACDESGRVVVSTLPVGVDFSEAVTGNQLGLELDEWGTQPTLLVGDTRYYTARFRPRSDATVTRLYVLFSEETWARARRDAALPPLMVGGLALVLTSVVAVWLAQRLSRRLRELQERVAGIAAGDFRQIPPGATHDEIQDLVGSVNHMAFQLRQMDETIRRSERTRLLAQLAGGLAHQLRNALTGARMALQLHRRRCPIVADEQSLEVALRQLSHVEIQVKGLLSVGRAERRTPIRCDVEALLADVRLLLEPACEHAGVRLTSLIECDGALSVVADREALRACVLNLALNAVEAAGPGGDVSLCVFGEGARVVVEVSDSGDGPPEELAGSLFEPFVTAKPEGVGLGLALARQVAVDHHGTLAWFRQNDRTVFRCSLPAAGDQAAPDGNCAAADCPGLFNSRSEVAS